VLYSIMGFTSNILSIASEKGRNRRVEGHLLVVVPKSIMRGLIDLLLCVLLNCNSLAAQLYSAYVSGN
jgi:hypothetical protein